MPTIGGRSAPKAAAGTIKTGTVSIEDNPRGTWRDSDLAPHRLCSWCVKLAGFILYQPARCACIRLLPPIQPNVIEQGCHRQFPLLHGLDDLRVKTGRVWITRDQGEELFVHCFGAFGSCGLQGSNQTSRYESCWRPHFTKSTIPSGADDLRAMGKAREGSGARPDVQSQVRRSKSWALSIGGSSWYQRASELLAFGTASRTRFLPPPAYSGRFRQRYYSPS